MDLDRRERRIKQLWRWTFTVGVLLIASLLVLGASTEYNPGPWYPTVFGSLALAFGSQLVFFGSDYDRMLARHYPDHAKDSELPARSLGFFVTFAGAAMIAISWLRT